MLRKLVIILVVVFLTSVVALAKPFDGGGNGHGRGPHHGGGHGGHHGGGHGGHHGGGHGGHPCIPEPATMTLIGVGLAGGAGLYAWRKRKRN